MDPELEADLTLLVSGLGDTDKVESERQGKKVFKRTRDTLGET